MIPEWLAAELDFPTPSIRAIVEGLQLTVLDGDPAQVAQQLGGQKTISKRQGNVLSIRPGSRIAVLRQIIREYGFPPFAPIPVPTSLQRQHSGVVTTEPSPLCGRGIAQPPDALAHHRTFNRHHRLHRSYFCGLPPVRVAVCASNSGYLAAATIHTQ